MPVRHICGLDEVVQLESRRPALDHAEDVFRWLFDPEADLATTVVRGFCVVVGFVVGFVAGQWTTTWSSTQARWGLHKLVHKSTEWASGFSTTAIAAGGSIGAGYMGEPTLAAAISGGEWISKGVHRLTETRMAQLYPMVVAEWSVEYFGTLGASVRVLMSLSWPRAVAHNEPEIE